MNSKGIKLWCKYSSHVSVNKSEPVDVLDIYIYLGALQTHYIICGNRRVLEAESLRLGES